MTDLIDVRLNFRFFFTIWSESNPCISRLWIPRPEDYLYGFGTIGHRRFKLGCVIWIYDPVIVIAPMDKLCDSFQWPFGNPVK